MEINTQNIVPRKGYLLIEAPEAIDKTATGVLLANNEDQGVPVMGTVLKTGEGCTIKEGSQVLFRRYSLDTVKIKTADGEKVFNLLEEESVLAIIGAEQKEN